MRFLSVCSGIEAASVAWEPLGWKAAAFSEIEPFPSAVLAHHYPDTPNLGDMNSLPGRILSRQAEAPDMLCGGTPCQAFSVAGLRQSLSDDRGGLTIKFVEIANAIDHIRVADGRDECIVFWENVPGVLSTKDNAFGCFLGALVGESDELVPAGGRWTNAGFVLGPQRAAAWRVLDAQYFGVAQRRRRVFVVASAREGFDPAAVLFEFDGLRRDSAPSREARQGAAAGNLRSTDGGCDVDHARAGHVQPVVGTLTASFGRLLGQSGQDADHGHSHLVPETAHTLRGEGFDASEDGTGRGTPLVPVAFQPGNLARGCGSSPSTDVFPTLKADHGRGQSDQDPHVMVPVCIHADAVGRTGEAVTPSPDAEGRVRLRNPGMGLIEDGTAYNLMATGQPHAVVAFDTTQVTSATNRSNPQPGDPCHPLAAGAHPPAIAFDCKASGMAGFGVGEIASTMRAMGHAGSHSNGGGQLAVAYTTKLHNTQSNQAGKVYEEYATSLDRSSPPPALLTAMQVRRLTPVECERLQGFPDGYTDIPWTEYQRIQKLADKAGSSFEAELKKRGKVLRGPDTPACPDGPRYKALGNSWAVPVVRWIGHRIQQHLLIRGAKHLARQGNRTRNEECI